MEKYLIAGVKVGMTLHEGVTKRQAEPYLCDFEGECDMRIELCDDFLARKHEELPHLSLEECEYIWTGFEFCNRLLKFDAFMLHASAVVYEGGAYLFSAPSGTGKSTHTAIWQRVFGEDKAYILNDDKPVIKLCGESVEVFGTPWSGKTDKNKNTHVPLRGICFLERAPQNSIEKLSADAAIYPILNQTLRPAYGADMSALLSLLDRLLAKTRVFRMGCNMEDEAARLAYRKMSGGCAECETKNESRCLE